MIQKLQSGTDLINGKLCRIAVLITGYCSKSKSKSGHVILWCKGQFHWKEVEKKKNTMK